MSLQHYRERISSIDRELLDAVTKLGARKKAAWPGREPFKPRALSDLSVEAPISVPHVSAALQQALAAPVPLAALLRDCADLLAQLQGMGEVVTPALDAAQARQLDLPDVHFDEASFRFALNEDAMATEKLAEGIRAFCVDAVKLEALMRA